MKIAVISDTHNLLREEVKVQLYECDLILHAGDVCSPAVYDELILIGKPMLTVQGNNDGRWADPKGIPEAVDTYLSEVEVLEAKREEKDFVNLRIYMVHNKRDIPADILKGGSSYDLVVFGHSHKYEEFSAGKTLFVNPGSCGPVRFRLPVTMAMVEIAETELPAPGKLKVQKIDLTDEKNRCEQREISPGEMKMLVAYVVKDIKRNKSAEQIAKKHKISLELSQQICRLYLTHPGVTVDGILGKMGM